MEENERNDESIGFVVCVCLYVEMRQYFSSLSQLGDVMLPIRWFDDYNHDHVDDDDDDDDDMNVMYEIR